MQIRRFRPGDEPALAEVCLRTADAGRDAAGVLEDDRIWAEIFVLPYVARHPEFAFVVESDAGEPLGYIVAAPDTRAFEAWFRDEWWPRFAARWPAPADEHTRQDTVLRYAYGRAPGADPYGDAYPAHLHIDLLPEAQGQGWGRRLIEALVAALRGEGVPGLHLIATADNTSALAFYRRLGFTAVPSPPDEQTFVLAL